MDSASSQLARSVVARCLDEGFALAGICRPAPAEHAAELRDWLARGEHGDMDFMTEALDVRLDPTRLLDGARSFVMVADLYAARGRNADPAPGAAHGRIARYVRSPDYHKTIKRRLHAICDALRAEHPGSRFRSFADTAPVLERELSERAALGWIGKNTMLINPTLGSYMVLGGFATTLDLEPVASGDRYPDHCGTCTRCIDACPTDAITPYHVDARRCISYLTIERRGPIDASVHAHVGDWAYGCDICQEVCPHNSPAPAAVRRSSQMVDAASVVGEPYRPERTSLDLLEVLGWDANDRRGAFNSSAMKRATLAMMKRNALIVLGNRCRTDPDPARRTRFQEAISDAMWNPKDPELVRDTAREILSRLTRETSPASQGSAAS